jgi:hypothetical protein
MCSGANNALVFTAQIRHSRTHEVSETEAGAVGLSRFSIPFSKLENAGCPVTHS